MKLQHLTDETLHKDTVLLVGEERGRTSKILHHLKEIDRRKLYSDFKCSSLFDYCVRLLGYSEGSAQRRIVAARLLREVPTLEMKIEKGALSLTNLSMANQFFRENKISSNEEKEKVFTEIENLSKKDCEKRLFEISGKEIKPREEKVRISKDKNKVIYILSDETLFEMEKLRGLLGKKLSNDELLQLMAKAAIEKIERQKFKQTQKPKTVSPAKAPRAPNASVKREVYKRDKACLQCGGRHHLNFDHIMPYALGGSPKANNIRLLCFNCNQRAKIKVFDIKETGPPFLEGG